MMAPGMDVKPPRIRTGNAFRATISRAKETSERAPHMMPVTRATIPAANQTITQICCSVMPTDMAAWWSSATARNARPIFDLLKKMASAATISAAMTAAAMSRCWKMTTPPNTSHELEPVGKPSSLVIIVFGSPPKIDSPKPIRNELSPIVAMKRMMSGWLTRGRRTTRSTVNASRNIMPIARITPSQAGTPSSCNPTSVRAPNTTMMPWAKLNIPDALKIKTKPSAISA